MADRKPPFDFDTDQLSQGIETIFGKAVEVLSKGREELLKQTRIGKVKLVDLMQLRRERARLVQRLGEEAYRGLQAGSLEPEDLERTYEKIVAMDEKIAAKEAEVERIRREEEAQVTRSRGAGGSRKARSTAGRSARKGGRRAIGDDEAESDHAGQGDDGE